jgi:hypothetical protein
MERTVPRTDSDQIDLYIRTYYSLLRSTGDISIETLVETHVGMDSLLHTHARDSTPDISALVYSTLRLPPCVVDVQLVILGQWDAVFERFGYPVLTWEEVFARARRRRSYFDGVDTLAQYIASRSDIDDLIPILTALQIEWNKIHRALASGQARDFVNGLTPGRVLNEEEVELLAAALGVRIADAEKLCDAWRENAAKLLRAMAAHPKRFNLHLLAGSTVDYRKATRLWWLHIESETPDISYESRPVYFVSSNRHSLANLWSGYALRQRETLYQFIEEDGRTDLLAEYEQIRADRVPSSHENFLYYAYKNYLDTLDTQEPEARAGQLADEREAGLRRIDSEHAFDLDVQVIELCRIRTDWLDPRVYVEGAEALEASDALIFNIDYPLGMAAYEILSRVSENTGEIAGVYCMGKAATLNGRIGDIMIPTVVHDEHSDNTYLFDNCFTAANVSPGLVYGTVLDQQKAVTVRGTFLQNARYMSVFYREGFTDIEMEAGPYLSAIYEMIRPKRHPSNEIVTLYPARFDIGILHYASDTPLSKGQNLGAGGLSYQGVDPTYAAAIAILKRIISQEMARLRAVPDTSREREPA